MYAAREEVELGGLASYGANLPDYGFRTVQSRDRWNAANCKCSCGLAVAQLRADSDVRRWRGLFGICDAYHGNAYEGGAETSELMANDTFLMLGRARMKISA